MKTIKLNILLIAVIALITVSCEQDPKGALYAGEAGKVSFLAKNYNPVLTDNDGNKILIPISRTSTDGDLSVGVTLKSSLAGYAGVFTVPNQVNFAAGAAASNVTVNYTDLSLINPGSLTVDLDAKSTTGKDIVVKLAFPFDLVLANKTLASPNKLDSVRVNASKVLNFQALGNGTLDSTDGWAGEVLNVAVEKAVGANVYKVKSPFGNRDIAFLIKSDGKTVTFPDQIIDKHSTYGNVTMGKVVGSITGKVVTLNVGSYSVSAGSFGAGVEKITLP